MFSFAWDAMDFIILLLIATAVEIFTNRESSALKTTPIKKERRV
jgi:hypothetical protein